MSCFGLCGRDQKPRRSDEFRVVYNRAIDTVVIETQTSDHEIPAIAYDTAAIIDCGSSRLRAGFAGDDTPSTNIPSVVGVSIENDVFQKVFGPLVFTNPAAHKFTYPVEQGFIKDWNDAEDLIEYVIDNHLRIQPKMNQLLLTEAPNNPPANREKTAEIMFEKLEFKGFLLAPSTPLGMYGYGETTGIVVESGAGQTHIVAIKDGECLRNTYRHIPIGGNDLTKYMGQLLSQSGKAQYFLGKPNEREILNEIKETGCHVVVNYNEEINKLESNPNLVYNTTILRDGTMIALRAEAFQVPELLLNPGMIGVETGGIPENIYHCVESCDPDLKAQMYENILLCGGNTNFDGFRDRLLWEVKTFAGPDVNVNINAPANRDDLVFLGASLVGVCPTFKDNLISLQEYREVGPQILQTKFL